jgi:hypothetical protein
LDQDKVKRSNRLFIRDAAGERGEQSSAGALLLFSRQHQRHPAVVGSSFGSRSHSAVYRRKTYEGFLPNRWQTEDVGCRQLDGLGVLRQRILYHRLLAPQ